MTSNKRDAEEESGYAVKSVPQRQTLASRTLRCAAQSSWSSGTLSVSKSIGPLEVNRTSSKTCRRSTPFGRGQEAVEDVEAAYGRTLRYRRRQG